MLSLTPGQVQAIAQACRTPDSMLNHLDELRRSPALAELGKALAAKSRKKYERAQQAALQARGGKWTAAEMALDEAEGAYAADCEAAAFAAGLLLGGGLNPLLLGVDARPQRPLVVVTVEGGRVQSAYAAGETEVVLYDADQAAVGENPVPDLAVCPLTEMPEAIAQALPPRRPQKNTARATTTLARSRNRRGARLGWPAGAAHV